MPEGTPPTPLEGSDNFAFRESLTAMLTLIPSHYHTGIKIKESGQPSMGKVECSGSLKTPRSVWLEDVSDPKYTASIKARCSGPCGSSITWNYQTKSWDVTP